MGDDPIQVESMRLVLALFICFQAWTSETSLGRKYFSSFLGHVHKNPMDNSSSMTIVQCQHSVKILSQENVPGDWMYVQVGEDKGYIRKKFLSDKRPKCFQDQYPHYYKSLNLDISEMYFWGRLNDHYLQGTTQIK